MKPLWGNKALDAKVRPNLTAEEKAVLDHLEKAWEAFLTLNSHHPDDPGEFRAALHCLQMIVAWRVARRVDPEEWA